MASSTSSPVKPPRPTYAPHNRHEVQTFVVSSSDDDEITVDQFWEELHYSSKDFRHKSLGEDVQPKGEFGSYMNKISKKMHTSCGLPPERLISFHDTSITPPLDHPTGTRCKPDFVACCSTENEIHWTGIDATIEIHSAGTSATGGLRQAVSYTLYLLKARPDRVSVQGMYVDDKGVVLISSSAAGIKKSPKLHLTDTSHIRLIHAFVKRLYDPHSSMVDPTITRRKDGPRWVFDISIPGLPLFRGYRILSAPDSLGQRTHIFVNDENPTLLNNIPIPIIKDQYTRNTHRFDEDEVIRHIHAKGEVPGAVRLAHAGVVQRGDGSSVSCGDREKVRICLSERGTPFMDIKTPLEVLMVIYDLLEITRYLYVNRHVLHRDISAGNVLHMEKDPAVTAPPLAANATDETPRHKFCSINHLLDPSKGYNSTSTLLIDFNRGEILDTKNEEARSERTGTPVFMARAVRKGRPLGEVGGYCVYSNVPALSPLARAAYEKAFPDRSTRFQYNSRRYIMEISDTNKLWRHELCHDAESAFWLLVWWAMHAFPEGRPRTEIPASVWGILTDVKSDQRNCDRFNNTLDPAYSPLEGLLKKLGEAVQSDLHWATDEPYTHPEFLHEVFQRHLLNFICDNQDKEFMHIPKADALRRPEENTRIPPLTNPQIETLRTCSSLKRSRDPEPLSGSLKRSRVS